ncbi:MAG: MFS transporter [Pseudomonadota bacterium]|nr:MFS transporter [Pseudomonadota bacterium]
MVSSDSSSKTSRAYSWYVVFMLTLLYIVSFLDRTVISLVIDPLKADLNVSDTQVSLLSGLAFALFYSVIGIPMGRLADRRSRRWIIGIGASFWSVMASLCGLAQSYTQLFLARVGLGVGEATLMPAAYSMISDYFPRKKLPRAYAVMMLGAPIGSGLAFVVGGMIADYAQNVGTVILPLIGEVRSWQLVFLITGIPGIFLGVWALLTIREPIRSGLIHQSGNNNLPIADVLAFVKRNIHTYGALLSGMSLTAMFTLGYLAWIAVFFMRTHGLDAGEVGRLFGPVATIGGVAGVMAGSFWCSWLAKSGKQDAPLRTAVHSLWIAIPCGIIAPLINDFGLSLALISVLVFFLTFPQGTNVAAFQLITPNEMRAQVSAVFLLVTNVFGLGLGATTVALFTDYLFGAPERINESLALMTAIVAIPALILLTLGLKPYRESLEASEAWQ